MLQPQEIASIENLLLQFHDIFARHPFDIGMKEEFKVNLTPTDDSSALPGQSPRMEYARNDHESKTS